MILTIHNIFSHNQFFRIREVTKEVTEKTTLDMARKLKSKNMDITDIMDITELSKDVIDTL